MPPQQPDRLLDLFYDAFDFGAHGFTSLLCAGFSRAGSDAQPRTLSERLAAPPVGRRLGDTRKS
jgi:hypothetical protein